MDHHDFFLSVETTRQGAIRGEAQDADHRGEIEVTGWRWGLQARTPMSGSGPAPKATLNELVVAKRIDSASTALMSALRNNDEIRKAVLVCRRAGGGQQNYVRLTLQKARITSLEVASEVSSVPSAAALREELTIAFRRIAIEYMPQGDDGRPRGATTFEAEV
jgi:type VI secretion system secreted protein Hcp